METQSRQTRLRGLLKRLNEHRKIQAKKIDILCNDLISAHREFIGKLKSLNFVAQFYESILAPADLSDLLSRAGRLIEQRAGGANVAFFLRQQDTFELYLHRSEQLIAFDKQSLESFFSAELVENICRSNRLCTLEDLFAMGLEGNLGVLGRLCAVTIPLSRVGCSLGFVLIYRGSEKAFKQTELKDIAAVCPGLCKAVVAHKNR